MPSPSSQQRKLFRLALGRRATKVLLAVPRSLIFTPVVSIRARARVHARGAALALFLLISLLGMGANLIRPAQTAAATSNTINFQARLEASSGAIVPDGWYNVEFKLYNASSGGVAQWTEDRTYSNGSSSCTGAPNGTGDCRVQLINGYLTANLGSITSFPGTINWDQQQWLTMNIGGTVGSGTITFDGEMNPRLQLTAVPYAFRAGQLADPANSGATLKWAAQGAANALLLPNEAGTLCTNASGGVCSALGFYIQNQTASPQSAGFNISGNGTIGGNGTIVGTLAVEGASALTLGSAANNGAEIFTSSGGSHNTVTLQAPTAGIGTGYVLSLPTAAPALGQCLQNDGTTIGQLTFSSCSAGSSLQGAYTSSTGSTTPEIILDTTRNGIDIQDKTGGTVGSTQSLLSVRGVGTASTLGASLFTVNASGQVAINNGGTTATPTISYDLSFGQGANRTIGVETQATAATAGNNLTVSAGTGNTTGGGGTLNLQGGPASATAGSAGGVVAILATNGTSTGTGAVGGAVTITAGNAGGSGVNNGGNITLKAGSATSTGTIGSVLVKNAADSTAAFQIQHAGSTADLLDADTLNSTVTLATQTGNDLAVATEQFTAAESFVAVGNWTTNGLTGSSATITHSAGSATGISPTPALSLVNNDVYQVTYTVTNPLAGTTLTVTMGGQTVATYTFDANSDNTFTDSNFVTVTSTGSPLTFTPSSGFTGVISAISVQLIAQAVHPILAVNNAAGAASLEVRASSITTNTFIGLNAGESNIGGNNNTAVGVNALQDNTSGSLNTALGNAALQNNTQGIQNTAVGVASLNENTMGDFNAALGNNALQFNTIGNSNVAVGVSALQHNINGNSNSAIGANALSNDTTGFSNTAVGQNSLSGTTTGYRNVGIGQNALNNNVAGFQNTAIGWHADLLAPASVGVLSNATTIGANAQNGDSNSIILGYSVANGLNDTVGIGSSFAPNELTVSPQTYGTNGTAGGATTITQGAGSGTVAGIGGTNFTTGMIGGTIYYSDGTTGTITAVGSTTSLTSSNTTGGWTTAAYNIVWGGFNVKNDATVLLQPTTNSTTAFQISNAAGTNTLFNADTTNTTLTLGGSGVASTVNIGTQGSAAINSTVNIANSSAGIQAVNIGSLNSTSATLIQGGTSVSIQTGAGAGISIGSSGTGPSLNIGAPVLTSGTQAILIGNNTSSGGTTNVTIGAVSPGAGFTTVQAPGALTLTGGATSTWSIGGANQSLTIQSTGTGANGLTLQTAGAGTVYLGDANTTTVDIGRGSNITRTINIGTGGSTTATSVNIGSGGATTSGSVTIKAATSAAATDGVIIGVADGGQTNLVLDNANTFADTGTCSNSVNLGAMYYNDINAASIAASATGSIRVCEGIANTGTTATAAWTDLPSTADLGAILFGVVPDSGNATNSQDLISAITAGKTGPCKVSAINPSPDTTVNIEPCVAYSGGRRVVVNQQTAFAITVTSGWTSICLDGTNNAPLSHNGTTELNSLPTFSTTAPVLCLASIKVSGTTITQVYDTRTFTTSTKEYVTASTALGLGYTAAVSGAAVAPLGTGTVGTVGSIRGVVVATNGSTSASTPNVIITVDGPAFAKVTDAGATAGQFVENSAGTAGYGTSSASGSAAIYGNLGFARNTTVATATCTSTPNAGNCVGATYVEVKPR